MSKENFKLDPKKQYTTEDLREMGLEEIGHGAHGAFLNSPKQRKVKRDMETAISNLPLALYKIENAIRAVHQNEIGILRQLFERFDIPHYIKKDIGTIPTETKQYIFLCDPLIEAEKLKGKTGMNLVGRYPTFEFTHSGRFKRYYDMLRNPIF